MLYRPLPLLVLAIALLFGSGANAHASCAGPEPDPVSVVVPALSVQADPGRDHYRSGETVEIRVAVHIADPSGPKVDRAEVKVDLTRAGKTIKNLKSHYAVTKQDGIATLRLKLPRGLPRGRLDAHVLAKREVVSGYDCKTGLVYGSGEETVTPFVTVG